MDTPGRPLIMSLIFGRKHHMNCFYYYYYYYCSSNTYFDYNCYSRVLSLMHWQCLFGKKKFSYLNIKKCKFNLVDWISNSSALNVIFIRFTGLKKKLQTIFFIPIYIQSFIFFSSCAPNKIYGKGIELLLFFSFSFQNSKPSMLKKIWLLFTFNIALYTK